MQSETGEQQRPVAARHSTRAGTGEQEQDMCLRARLRASERATSGHGRGNLLHMCILALHEAPKRREGDLQEPASSAGEL